MSAIVRKQDIFVQCDKSPDKKSPDIQLRGKCWLLVKGDL